MKIIEIEELSNGAHRNQTTIAHIPVPSGWAVIKDGVEIPDIFPFVHLTIEDGVVTSMTANTEAWEAWKASLPPEPDPEPTVEEITLDLMADHEERICMLELNA